MSDYLTRLIERSRGLAPQGQQVEPVIAPVYAPGPNTAPRDNEIFAEKYEETTSVTERVSHSFLSKGQDSGRRGADDTHFQRSEGSIPIAPLSQRRVREDKDTDEIKSGQAPADEKTQSAFLNQTLRVKPLLQTTTAKSPLAPVNERPGTYQYATANQKPMLTREQTVAHSDEANSRAAKSINEPTLEMGAPVIRVTIGRVDVRAVTPSVSPARRSSPAAPKLSLEEYLRSRSGKKL
jgi:hypothetical protein